MVKRILVGLGGTPFTRVAIQHATDLARVHGSQLTGVTIADVRRLEDVGPVPIGGEAAAHDLREHRLAVTKQCVHQAIDDFESACKTADISYTVKQETGDAFSLLASLARYHDLMVFGLRSIFDYGLHDDPPDMLLHLLSRGVRPIIAVSEQYKPIRRVLIAYGGSMESAKTIRRFMQMRLWPDLTLRLVTFEGNPDDAEHLLADMAEYCNAHGFDPELQHHPESARHYLLEHAAEWGADLIVMGNSGRSVLLSRIMGETALHVIRTADHPLFLSQ